MTFDPPEIPTDQDAVTNDILDDLMDLIPGYVPVEGALDVALVEEVGLQTALTNQLALTVIQLAVAGFGETGLGFPVYQGATAWIETQVTLTSTAAAAGTTIPAGFSVIGNTASAGQVAFQLLTDLAVPAGATNPVGVVLYATDEGDYANGVPAGSLLVITVNTDVASVTAVAGSTGGADPEELADYLDRLTDFTATLRPGGVRAADLAALAKSVPGVQRALGVDLYDPTNPSTPAERTATVFAVDTAGNPVSGAVAAQLQTTLQAAREVNFVINVTSPQYTRVQVTYTATADTGASPSAVQAAINAAVLAWLDDWGTTDDDTAWIPAGTVRYLDLARVIGDVPGVTHLLTLQINGTAADLVMSGVAALPTRSTASSNPSTCTGTVS